MAKEGKPKVKKSRISKREEKDGSTHVDDAHVSSVESKDSGSTIATISTGDTAQASLQVQQGEQVPLKNSSEVSLNLVEVRSEDRKVLIGPARLTRFERARIVGARALQLSLGAPPLIPVTGDAVDPISIAESELNSKALPISIRRILPDGHYQDIPISWLMN